MSRISRGDKFLPSIPKEELNNLYKQETKSKPKLRLLVALLRKEGKTLDSISFSLQKPKTTIHDWLKRLNEGLANLYDTKQAGKPPKLDEKQLQKLKKILGSSPENYNIPFKLWTTKLAQYIICEKFQVFHKIRQIRNIAKKLGFTLQVPREEHYKANKKAQERFKKNLKLKYNIILNLDLRSSVLTKHISE